MAATLRTRRRAGSMVRMLLAVVLLTTRLVAPSMSAPVVASPEAAALAALLSGDAICHAGSAQDGEHAPSPAKPIPGHAHDCGLCPACHLMGAPALLADGVADITPPATWTRQRRAVLPPAIGPPQVLRTAARPRGPPAFSV